MSPSRDDAGKPDRGLGHEPPEKGAGTLGILRAPAPVDDPGQGREAGVAPLDGSIGASCMGKSTRLPGGGSTRGPGGSSPPPNPPGRARLPVAPAGLGKTHLPLPLPVPESPALPRGNWPTSDRTRSAEANEFEGFPDGGGVHRLRRSPVPLRFSAKRWRPWTPHPGSLQGRYRDSRNSMKFKPPGRCWARGGSPSFLMIASSTRPSSGLSSTPRSPVRTPVSGPTAPHWMDPAEGPPGSIGQANESPAPCPPREERPRSEDSPVPLRAHPNPETPPMHCSPPALPIPPPRRATVRYWLDASMPNVESRSCDRNRALSGRS